MSLHLLLKSLLLFLCFSHLSLSIETDTITKSLVIQDPDSIVSNGKIYKLGFFTPENSTSRYFGIFNYVSETSIIWVANRNTPLSNDSSPGSITISEDGNVVLMNRDKIILWSSNIESSNSSRNLNLNISAQLQDSGNLILSDNANGRIIWQSFNHPADVFVPTMKITNNRNTGKKILLTSWKTLSNPEIGSFTAGIDILSIPQVFIWNGTKPYWRSGPWNGLILTGVTDMYAVYLDGYSMTKENDGTVSFTRNYYAGLIMKIILKPNGSFVQTMWDKGKREWNVTWVAPIDNCDVYGVCGPFANCNNLRKSVPICSCLKGYEPVNGKEWENQIWSGGCKRSVRLQFDRNGTDIRKDEDEVDKFARLMNVKVPDSMEVLSGVKDHCEKICSTNNSCIAYSFDTGIGCMFWSNTLIDIRQYPSGGSDLFIRVAYSVLPDKKKDFKLIIIASVLAGMAASICLFLSWCLVLKKRGKKRKLGFVEGKGYASDSSAIVLKDDMGEVNLDELPLYSFAMLSEATDEFDEANLLGKGGFGPVYKGKFEKNGKEIAVKRLSRASGQGLKEFMNEVVVISKLQHRNLVSLLGCCVEKEEKMLVYEYMINRSLDLLLFDASKDVLDWKRRFSIVEGIGRGLLYLHRDSRLRIIHRDLKPSNVLLDENWNPKISDFGMARIFGGLEDEDQAKTARVVGTYGYMAPEYAMGGRFSEKSDVFSFGVIVLEIISGRRNTSFYDEELGSSLLEYVWKLWVENSFEPLIDERVLSSEFKTDIVRSIHIGLLCVQEFPTNRPTISNVLSMLAGEIAELPLPERPPFTQNRSCEPSSSSQSRSTTS